MVNPNPESRVADGVLLRGRHVTLRPLGADDADALLAAAGDGELWNMTVTTIPGPATVGGYIDKALSGRAGGTVMPFAIVRNADGTVVGSTRYWKIDRDNRKLEIGHTWLALAAQRTAINTEAKYLLLSHAFEAMGCLRVQFQTDELNLRSRAAIARLGAVQEGILRKERVMPDGRQRNTVRFSIVDDEWPGVKARLEERLKEQFRPAARNAVVRWKWLMAVPACLAAYLGVAAAWAWTGFDEAVAAVTVPAQAPLTASQRDILLLAEDPAFFRHAGISLAPGTGLATISSSAARDLFLDGADLTGTSGVLQRFYRGVFACCRKIDLGRDVMGMVVDARLPKESLLALYVSRVYMGTQEGEEVRGLPQAAQRYLGKPLAAATDDEFTGLAAMIKAPNLYHPLRNPAAHAERKARIVAQVAAARQARRAASGRAASGRAASGRAAPERATSE